MSLQLSPVMAKCAHARSVRRGSEKERVYLQFQFPLVTILLWSSRGRFPAHRSYWPGPVSSSSPQPPHPSSQSTVFIPTCLTHTYEVANIMYMRLAVTETVDKG
jgi:hypothetical protein